MSKRVERICPSLMKVGPRRRKPAQSSRPTACRRAGSPERSARALFAAISATNLVPEAKGIEGESAEHEKCIRNVSITAIQFTKLHGVNTLAWC